MTRANDTSAPPLMPDAPQTAAGAEQRRALWEFHLSGCSEDGEPGPPLLPAAIGPTLEPERAARDYPLVVVNGVDGEPPSPLLRRLVDGPGAAQGGRTLLGQAESVSRSVLRAVERRGGSAPFGETLDEVLRELDGKGTADETAIRAEIARLGRQLPEGATLLGLGADTPLLLYVDALRRERTARQEAFGNEARSLAVRLAELLPASSADSADGISPAILASRLGAAAERFIDPRALAGNLSGRRGGVQLDSACRTAVQGAIDTLTQHARRFMAEPQLIVVAAEERPLPESIERMRTVRDAVPCRAAVSLFDEQAARLVPVLRAARLARLALTGAFGPDQLARLARFDWQAAGPEELALLPAVLVLENEEQLDGASLAPFTRLLRSGRPIRLLVEASPLGGQPLDEHRVRPVNIALAHGEALTIQSSPSETEHLIESLGRVVRSLRTAALFVPRADDCGPVAAWTRLVAALAGRATPCLHQDPDRQEGQGLDLDGNPQRERDWPIQQVRFRKADGTEGSFEEAFTFAHTAALEPAYRRQLRLIPLEAWDDEQCDIRTWVEASQAERLRRLPFLWVMDGERRLDRALMTRELAFACHEARRSWLDLRRRAGIRGADDEAAKLPEEPPAPPPEAAPPRLERLRTEAVEGLIRGLLGEAVIVPPQEVAPPVQVEAAATATSVVAERPTIESSLCTSCNDCTKINPRMFQYDENKQAYIADANAGSFAELVRAAEKCPARCIHPGSPRAGDSTATEKMIARAEKYR